MPAKSKKQQRFMAAVANNPKFAKKVGVPKSVGEEFMKKGYMGGGMMRRYARGGMMEEMMDGMDSPGEGVSEENIRAIQAPQDAPAGFRPMVPDEEMEGKKKAAKKKAPAKKKMKHGGKVRGCGAVSKKMRPAKMVVMKGS